MVVEYVWFGLAGYVWFGKFCYICVVWFGLLLVKLVGTATSVFTSQRAVLRRKGSLGTAVMT